jgi:hypothetical protein
MTRISKAGRRKRRREPALMPEFNAAGTDAVELVEYL